MRACVEVTTVEVEWLVLVELLGYLVEHCLNVGVCVF